MGESVWMAHYKPSPLLGTQLVPLTVRGSGAFLLSGSSWGTGNREAAVSLIPLSLLQVCGGGVGARGVRVGAAFSTVMKV